MTKTTYYPSFDVMREKNEWDAHTQSVVTSRLDLSTKYSFLTPHEAQLLELLASILLGDARWEVLHFVLSHFDQALSDSELEGQRKADVPYTPILIRSGLQAIDESALRLYGLTFGSLDEDQQFQYVSDLSQGFAQPGEVWQGIPQGAFFKKVMNLLVEAYCSHPKVWSEMGYAGPAYPRGYVRSKLRHLEPWEAKAEQ